MSAKHTQGLLAVNPCRLDQIATADASKEIARVTNFGHSVDTIIANARRLVACWNACDGIGTEALETEGSAAMGWARTASKLLQATTQRDELLASVQELIAATKSEGGARIGHIYQPATREHEMREAMAWQRLQAAVTQSGGIPPVVEFKRAEGGAA
ncbi:MAG: hypothetical protein RLZZ22_141 [Pseudomonadota bacterium]|jgi:hypothetical protein